MRVKDESMGIWLISGLWIFLGCAEAAHLFTIMTDRSLHTYSVISIVFGMTGFFIYTMCSIYLQRRKKTTKKIKYQIGKKQDWMYIALFIVLSIITMRHFCGNYVPNLQDAVYEITLENTVSGTLMTKHPFLGTDPETGMPMRMQILGLSSFYSALITISKQSVYTILCKVVPMFVWVCSMLLYWTIGQAIFSHDRRRSLLFISFVACIFIVTSKIEGTIGNRLFFAGFSPETIRAVLLIPYTIYVSWEKKWHLAVLAVVIEACLVWTTFGIGYCFLIMLCMYVIHRLSDRRAAYADRME